VGISAARAAAVASGVALGAALLTTYHILLPPAAQAAAQAWQALQHSVEGHAHQLAAQAAVAAAFVAVFTAVAAAKIRSLWYLRNIPGWRRLMLASGVATALAAAPAAYLASPYLGEAVAAALGWASSSLASASASVASTASSPYISPAAVQVVYAVASLLGWLSWALGSLAGLPDPFAGLLLALPAAAVIYAYHASKAEPSYFAELAAERREVWYRGPMEWLKKYQEQVDKWRREVARWEEEYKRHYDPERCAKEILAEAAKVVAETCECDEGGAECYGTGKASRLGYICRAARAFSSGPVQGYEVVYDDPGDSSVRHRVRVEVDRAEGRVRIHIERYVNYGREKDWDETFECRAGDIPCIRGVLALFVKDEHEVYKRVAAKGLKSGCLEPPPPPPPPKPVTARELARLEQVRLIPDSVKIILWGLRAALPAEDVFYHLLDIKRVRKTVGVYNIGKKLAGELLREVEAGRVELPEGLKVYPDGTVEYMTLAEETSFKTLMAYPISVRTRVRSLWGFVASATAIAGVFAAFAPPHIAVPAVVGAAAGALVLIHGLVLRPRVYVKIDPYWAASPDILKRLAPQDPEVDAGRGTFADMRNVRLVEECGKWCYWRVFRLEYTRWQERAKRWDKLLYVLAAAPTTYLYVAPLLPGDTAVWASAAATGLGLAAAATAGFPVVYFGPYWAYKALKYLERLEVKTLVLEETLSTKELGAGKSVFEERWERMWSTTPKVLEEGKGRVSRKILSHLLGLPG